MISTPITTLIVLLFGFIVHLKLYKSKIILHHSFWYFVIWISSVLAFLLYEILDYNLIIIKEKYLKELFTFVSFTSICLTTVSLVSHKKYQDSLVLWSTSFSERRYQLLSLGIFFISIIDFYVRGGTDIVVNRVRMVEMNELVNVENQSLPIAFILLNLLLILNLPMLILSGYFIGRASNKRLNNEFRLKIYYFLPFLTEVIRTWIIGGRSGILMAFVELTFGVMLGITSTQIDLKSAVSRYSRYAIIFLIVFSIYSTWVNYQRGGEKYISQWSNYPYLRPFGGVLQYLTDHYPGYQLRRDDLVTEEKEMGLETFSGLTMFNFPGFSYFLGDRLTLHHLLKLKEINQVKESYALKARGRPWANTTTTVYLILFDDFGFTGTLVAIALFTIISQVLFNRLFSHSRVSFISLLPFFIIYILWAKSTFSHHIVGNWLGPMVFIFLLMDLIRLIREGQFLGN